MSTAVRVFSRSSIGFLIALMIGCSWISNDAYETSHYWHREGRRALQQTRYFQAQEYLDRAVQMWPRELADSPDSAAVQNNLGRAFAARREYEEAVKSFEKGRAVFRINASCSHPFQAVLLNNLCDSRMGQNRWTDAQGACLSAFKANIKHPPKAVLPDVPPEDIAWGLFNWGVAWAQVNNSASYHGRVAAELAQYQENLGPAKISDVYFQLGRLSLLRGDPMDSEQFHQQALTIRIETLGWLHESTADSLAAVGQAKLCQRQFPSAEDHERRALSLRQTLLATGHPDLARSYLGIGLVLEAQGKLQEALNSYWQGFHACYSALAVTTSESFRQTLRRCAETTSPGSPEQSFLALKKCRSAIEMQTRLAAMSLHGIGRTLSELDRHTLAEHFDGLALSAREATLGPRHPLTLQSHLAVGRAFEAKRNFAEAKIHYWRALGIAETTLGPEHRVTGVTLYALSRIMRLQGQAEDADRFLNSALSILQKEVPPGGSVSEEYVRGLQGLIDRQYCIGELQGPDVRTTIAWDSPHLPRDHQLLSEFLEKKKDEFLVVIQPGQSPEVSFKRFINMIDDPFDDFKHEIHGMKLFGYRVFWPEGFMRGAGDPCK